MNLGKKLLVSALIAAAVVIVASTVVIAMPQFGGYNSPGIQTNSQPNAYTYNQRSGYSKGYGGSYGHGGCMGGGGYRGGSYRGGMGYYPNGAASGYVDFVEVTGTLEETHWSYIVLNVDGEALDIYGPSWFWHIINPATGDNVEVIGEVVSMTNWYGETHTEIMPFELTINGITYGNANLGIPVWNQRDI
jgi:hypothetical protein